MGNYGEYVGMYGGRWASSGDLWEISSASMVASLISVLMLFWHPATLLFTCFMLLRVILVANEIMMMMCRKVGNYGEMWALTLQVLSLINF